MPRLIEAFSQFFDDNGDPLVNGKLKFVESGTNNTDKDTFADINETIANTNPVILDGAGRCPNVFGTGSYNIISYTSADVQIQQFDPVSGDTLEGAFSIWNAITIYGVGDIVTGSDGLYYRSISSANQNQNPVSTPGQWEEIKFVGIWNTVITYDAGDTVYGSDGILYYSLISANIGNDPITDDVNWRSYLFNTSTNIFDNTGFTATIAAKALTFDLKTKGLTDPTALDTVKIAFRSETLTTGDYDVVDAIAATSIVVPSGATLGFEAVETNFIYLYAINNAGEIELAVSGELLDDSIVHTTVAISAASDSADVLYSTALRSNIPIKLYGRIKITTGAIAGEWDNAPTELFVGESATNAINKVNPQLSKVWVNFNGTGTVAIRDSFNVSSITDNSVANYTVNFTNAMSDTEYNTTFGGSEGTAGTVRAIQHTFINHAVGSIGVKVWALSTTPALTAVDLEYISVTIFSNS